MFVSRPVSRPERVVERVIEPGAISRPSSRRAPAACRASLGRGHNRSIFQLTDATKPPTLQEVDDLYFVVKDVRSDLQCREIFAANNLDYDMVCEYYSVVNDLEILYEHRYNTTPPERSPSSFASFKWLGDLFADR